MKLLVDLSSVLGAYLHLRDEEFGLDVFYTGEEYHIPDVETCLERFQYSVEALDIPIKDFIVVKDPGGGCPPREKILESYKSKVRISPPEFFETRERLFKLATAWLKSQGGIIATPKNGAEADDLINELAKRVPNTLIWSRDKDLLACPTSMLYQDKDGIHLDPEKFPVPDKYIHVYRTIVTGDASDNIGSCKGFGPKAWDKMIEVFGEDSIDDLDFMLREECLGKLEDQVVRFPKLQLLIDQAEDLYKYYKVICFFPVPSHMVKWEGGMLEGPSTLVTKNNFDSVFAILSNTEFDYSVIDYETDNCEESKEWCKRSGVKVDMLGSEICGMGLRINDENFYFCVDHKDTDNIDIDQLESVLEILWDKTVYAHNAVFENVLTHNHYKTFLPHMVCTQIMASYVDENDYHNLKHLSKRWLDYRQITYADTVGGRSGMRELTGEEVVGYGIDDVITTDSLVNLFTVILQYENTLEVLDIVENDSLYYTTMCYINGVDFDEKRYRELKTDNDRNTKESWAEISSRLLELGWEGGEFKEIRCMNIVVLRKIYKTIYGVALDKKLTSVKAAVEEMEDREFADLIENKNYNAINVIYEQHWKPEAEFSVGSAPQLSKLLYDVLKLPVRIRNRPTDKMRKEGRPGSAKTDEKAILNAITYKDTKEVELLELILEHKGYLTKESLFFHKWPLYVHWKTGKIHGSLRQSNTTTRRSSHEKPNKAQLPKKKGREVRDMITVPGKDWYLWALDIDSQELKLQAWESQDENFLSCYLGEEKKDVHALTGYEVASFQKAGFKNYEEFESQLEGAAKPYRVSGKTTNFSSAYLCSARTLSFDLRVTEKVAEGFLKAKDQAFPGLMKATRAYIAKCRKRKYAKTFLGARRHLHGRQHFGSRDDYIKEAAGRLAWSFRIQSSAGEQTKLIQGALYREGLFDDGLCLPCTSVHDEVVGIIHVSVMEERMPKLVDCMCQDYADMKIKTTTTPKIGQNFGSLTEWEG